jgi:hypothetical protein
MAFDLRFLFPEDLPGGSPARCRLCWLVLKARQVRMNRKIPLVIWGRAFFLRSAVAAAISASRRAWQGSPTGSGTAITRPYPADGRTAPGARRPGPTRAAPGPRRGSPRASSRSRPVSAVPRSGDGDLAREAGVEHDHQFVQPGRPARGSPVQLPLEFGPRRQDRPARPRGPRPPVRRSDPSIAGGRSRSTDEKQFRHGCIGGARCRRGRNRPFARPNGRRPRVSGSSAC